MDCVFFGTPDFAIPALKALISSDKHRVKAVFTQPDKKVGRKQVLTSPPVKELAVQNNIPVYQPQRIRDEEWLNILRDISPDIIVTAAFGQILSGELLAIPKKGTVNVHGSLLPEYRGPAPIQWAVINGEKITGVSTMFTDEGIDTGDVLLKRETEISETETAGELFERLADIGAELLLETLNRLDNIVPVPQIEEKASYYPMLKKEMAVLNFKDNAEKLNNLIRGLNPWPLAHFFIDGLKVNVYEARVVNKSGKPGEVLSWDSKNGVIIACGENAIQILKLQPAGKKIMAASDFANGKKVEAGKVL